MIRFRLLLIFVCCLFTTQVSCCLAVEAAAEQFYARTWMTDDGLPHNIVTHLIQDRAGYIWLATSGGLARFDGREFKAFPLPPELQKKGYNIRGLAELPDSSLLLLLPDGSVAQFRAGKFSIHPVTAVLTGKTPTDLFVEPGEVIWVGTADGSLLRWQNGQTTEFGKAEGIDRRSPVFSFATDLRGRTWVATGRFLGYYEKGSLVTFSHSLGSSLLITSSRSGGLWILADTQLLELNSELDFVSHAAPPLPAFTLPRQIFEDRDHGVWIATRRQGLFRFARAELEHVPFSCDFVLAITADREGSIWVGTEGEGVSILRSKFCTVLDSSDGLPQVTSAVCSDENGGVWLANRNSGLNHLIDGHLKPLSSAKGLIVNTVTMDQSGNLWLGAASGLYQVDKNQEASIVKIEGINENIRTLYCARDGDIWFGTAQGQLGRLHDHQAHFFSIEEGYTPESVTSIAEELNGVVWIGGSKGSLYQFSKERLRLISLPQDIPTLPIHALHFDKTGLLWIGTADGLLLYSKQRFQRIAAAEGLTDSLIVQINEDDSGHLWLGSSHGLFRTSRQQLLDVAANRAGRVEIMKIGKDDGVPSLSLLVGSQPLSARDTHGRIWFTAMQQVLTIDPTKLSSSLPQLHAVLQETRVDSRVIESTPVLQIPSGKHRVEFQFAILSYAALEKARLQYQVEGIDPDWVDTGASRTASYASLPPGDYNLRFRARTEENNSDWNSDTFKFSIIPAWWETIWARAGAIALVVVIALLVFRRYSHWHLKLQLEKLQRAHALDKERARIARDLHDELGGSLTRIAFGVDQLKQTLTGSESNELLDQLSQRVRRHASDLQRVVWVESPKNDSLDRVCFFIVRFAQDYFRDSSIRCIAHASTDVPANPIQPEVQHHLVAIAKEAFNNVLKHSKASEVSVRAWFEAPRFFISIVDNGVGFSPDTENDFDHNGLTNMRSRTAEIGGNVSIQSHLGAGTTVRITWAAPSLSARTENAKESA